MSLLQILQSLKTENDYVSKASAPPRMVLSTVGVINDDDDDDELFL